MNIGELTLLTKEQIEELDIFKKMGKSATITDFAILLGGYVKNDTIEEILEERRGNYWTKTFNDGVFVKYVECDDTVYSGEVFDRENGIRPVMSISSIENLKNRVTNAFDISEFEYGEYPVQAVNEYLGQILEDALNLNILNRTGKVYTTDSVCCRNTEEKFEVQQHVEYEYEGKKYVRVIANLYSKSGIGTLSNDMSVKIGDIVWVEVQPLIWLVDEKAKLAVCKKIIISGICFDTSFEWKENFENTEMNWFLQTYLKKDIIPSKIKLITEEEKQVFEKKKKELEKKRNPYGLDINKVSEEDIIKGAIESGVEVFLHGSPSEGESARVKQIDPTCEMIYLRNSNPESLNGKSVYNSQTCDTNNKIQLVKKDRRKM